MEDQEAGAVGRSYDRHLKQGKVDGQPITNVR